MRPATTDEDADFHPETGHAHTCTDPTACDCAARLYNLAASLSERLYASPPATDGDAAAAWDRGYAAGFSNAMRRMSDEPNAPTSPNPFRAAPPVGDTETGTPGPAAGGGDDD